jgi:spore coat polysaccharide biosynthesis predicted glycosyltransferase SpsG/RimJ/RimL family protein N-acetyltransferase
MTFLLLRADAAPSLGVGHLSRCVAIASAARARGWDVALCGTFAAGQWLIGDLPVVPSLVAADVVLVDHYGLGEMSVPSLVVSMEDGTYGRRRADIVVDANLYTEPRPDDGSPVVLRGPAYAPLRAEIRAARAARGEGSTPPSVVVVMGGGAAPSAVAAAVKALRETDVPASVVAISAAPVPGVETIPPTPDLPSLLASADLVVSAAGVTLMELCCIGAPAALVRIADNQMAGYNAAVDQGLAAGLGTDPREHVATLRTLLLDANARKALGDKAMAVVDGKGADRILDSIEARLHESPIGTRGGPPFSTLPASTDSSAGQERGEGKVHPPSPSERTFRAPGGPPISTLPGGTDNSVLVRPANEGDAALLLVWRNDSETRAWSRTTDPVAPADHAAWLEKVLADPDRQLLIAELDHQPIGTVRFDRDGDHWEVSITLAPEARGRKLAVPMLLAAERTRTPADIRACVHKDNTASLKLFRRAGYEQDSSTDQWVWLAKTV